MRSFIIITPLLLVLVYKIGNQGVRVSKNKQISEKMKNILAL